MSDYRLTHDEIEEVISALCFSAENAEDCAEDLEDEARDEGRSLTDSQACLASGFHTTCRRRKALAQRFRSARAVVLADGRKG